MSQCQDDNLPGANPPGDEEQETAIDAQAAALMQMFGAPIIRTQLAQTNEFLVGELLNALQGVLKWIDAGCDPKKRKAVERAREMVYDAEGIRKEMKAMQEGLTS